MIIDLAPARLAKRFIEISNRNRAAFRFVAPFLPKEPSENARYKKLPVNIFAYRRTRLTGNRRYASAGSRVCLCTLQRSVHERETCAVWICTGCSRATINYQVAESLGTLGQFENNEPVETPKMREQREQAEAQAAAQTQLDEQMEHAQRLADGYWYEEAIEYLNGLEKNEFNNDAINAAVEEYTRLQDSIIVYEGKVPHLCFPHLIEDTGRAFDGDDYAYTYSGSLLTVSEFRGIRRLELGVFTFAMTGSFEIVPFSIIPFSCTCLLI